MAIYQEMVDTRGFAHAYNSVKRFCGGLRREEPEQFDRLEFAPAKNVRLTTVKVLRPATPSAASIASRGCS